MSGIEPMPAGDVGAATRARRRVGVRGRRLWILAAVASFVVFTVPVLLVADEGARPWASLLLGALVAAPLAWAWRAPVPVVVLVAGGLVVAALAGVRVTPFVSDAGPALGLAAFACGAQLQRRRGATVVALAAAAVSVAGLVALGLRPEDDQDLVQLLIAATGWLLGDAVRTRRALRAQVAAQEAQRVAAVEARIRAEERLRLSRDVHDVVSHSLSLVAVRAGAGRLLLDDDPEEARAALRTIEEVSRGALDELRDVLAGMRDVSAGPGPDRRRARAHARRDRRARRVGGRRPRRLARDRGRRDL